MRIISAVVLTGAMFLTGCISQTTRDLRTGPQFTQAEKDRMTEEEKLGIYNSLVRDKDQLVCVKRSKVGSRLKRTECRTEFEMVLEGESAREALRQSRGGTRGGGGSPIGP